MDESKESDTYACAMFVIHMSEEVRDAALTHTHIYIHTHTHTHTQQLIVKTTIKREKKKLI